MYRSIKNKLKIKRQDRRINARSMVEDITGKKSKEADLKLLEEKSVYTTKDAKKVAQVAKRTENEEIRKMAISLEENVRELRKREFGGLVGVISLATATLAIPTYAEIIGKITQRLDQEMPNYMLYTLAHPVFLLTVYSSLLIFMSGNIKTLKEEINNLTKRIIKGLNNNQEPKSE